MSLIMLTDPRPPGSDVAPASASVAVQHALPMADSVWAVADPEPVELALPHRFSRTLLEVMAGLRPLSHLEPAVNLDVLRICALCAKRRRRLVGRSLRASSPAPGVWEVSLRVTDIARHADGAVAFRLEREDHRVRCTALELGPL